MKLLPIHPGDKALSHSSLQLIFITVTNLGGAEFDSWRLRRLISFTYTEWVHLLGHNIIHPHKLRSPFVKYKDKRSGYSITGSLFDQLAWVSEREVQWSFQEVYFVSQESEEEFRRTKGSVASPAFVSNTRPRLRNWNTAVQCPLAWLVLAGCCPPLPCVPLLTLPFRGGLHMPTAETLMNLCQSSSRLSSARIYCSSGQHAFSLKCLADVDAAPVCVSKFSFRRAIPPSVENATVHVKCPRGRLGNG